MLLEYVMSIFRRIGEPNHGRGPVLKDQSTYSVVNIGDKVPLGETASIPEGQSLPPRVAWVLCDDCEKWRCIPASLADIIDETKCGWYKLCYFIFFSLIVYKHTFFLFI